jgi:hypothetical protein
MNRQHDTASNETHLLM